jgi:predicted lipoprotein with Yx(FWY)xxD motif
VACFATLAIVPAASAGGPKPLPITAPQGLKAFLLRADEQASHTFSRTPAFAWKPVPGAVRYEFELSTSKKFTDNAIIYGDKALTSPVVAIPIALPWSSGNSYSLFVHARAVTRKGATPWSDPYGFAMRWSTLPQPILPAYPGLLRWTTVPGATAYQVWEVDTGKQFTTLTNVADEREFYTFHQNAPWISSVRWRIRAIRNVKLGPQNGVPATQYGPWSPIYTSVNPPFAVGGMAANATVSDVVSDATTQQAHRLMPAFLFSGDSDMFGQTQELYHVYVFTDSDCLNMVYNSSVVGSPAYAPRVGSTLGMPNTLAAITAARSAYLDDGSTGAIYTYDKQRIVPSDSGGAGASTYPPIDLWDVDWPTGRYYWTVVPVAAVQGTVVQTTLTVAHPSGSSALLVGNAAGFAAGDVLDVGTGAAQEAVTVASIAGNTITLAGSTSRFHAAGEVVSKPAGTIEYHDTELAQETCASGRVLTFGKTSEPAMTSGATPFVSGLSPNGKLFAAKSRKPAVYGPPLVAWQPALGAIDYEIQWSSTPSSVPTENDKVTQTTSFVLPVKAGTWYYRVRGLDYAVPNKPQMTWSDVVAIRVAKPTFRVVK